MAKEDIFKPIEVLTFNHLDKLIVLPNEHMPRYKIPFRYEKKWWRRENNSQTQILEIKIVFEKNQLIILDYDIGFGYVWQRRKTLFEGNLIAVFEEFLTNYEKKHGVLKLNYKNE